MSVPVPAEPSDSPDLQALARQLVTAADQGFVSEALASRLRSQLHTSTLSLAFPVPTDQQLLASLGDLTSWGYKSLRLHKRDETAYGFGQRVYGEATAQPTQCNVTADCYVVASADASNGLYGTEAGSRVSSTVTVLAAELDRDRVVNIREAKQQVTSLGAAIGACLATQACSVPQAADAFLALSHDPPPSLVLQGRCSEGLSGLDRDDATDADTIAAFDPPIGTHPEQDALDQPLAAHIRASAPDQESMHTGSMRQQSTVHPQLQPTQSADLRATAQMQPPSSASSLPDKAETSAQSTCPQGKDSTPKKSAAAPQSVTQISTTSQHPFWLTFGNAALERKYLDHLAHQMHLAELLGYYLPMVWGMVELLFRRPFADPKLAKQCPIGSVLLFAFLLAWACSACNWRMYVRHREPILMAIRLITAATWTVSIAPTMLVDPYMPDDAEWFKLLNGVTMLLWCITSPISLMVRFQRLLHIQIPIVAAYMTNLPLIAAKLVPDRPAVPTIAMLALAQLGLSILLPLLAVRKIEQSSRSAFLFKNHVRVITAI